MTVYGPYTRSDGRQHVIHYDPVTKSRRTQSYPRYLIEQHLGITLENWQDVDHINDDHTDNRLENLQVISTDANNDKARKPIEYYFFNCPVCEFPCKIPMRQYRANQIRQDKAGPYCSKQCAGKIHH